MTFNRLRRLATVSTLVVAPLALTSACRDEVLTDLAGGVAGQVCNPITGRPAAGATVTAQYFNDVTKKDDEKTLYDILCSCLNQFLAIPIYVIFLSTNSNLAQFASPRALAKSAR